MWKILCPIRREYQVEQVGKLDRVVDRLEEFLQEKRLRFFLPYNVYVTSNP